MVTWLFDMTITKTRWTVVAAGLCVGTASDSLLYALATVLALCAVLDAIEGKR